MIAAGAAASMIPVPMALPERMTALIKLGEIGIGCLLMAWPALMVTNSISSAERRSLLDSVMPGRRRIAQVHN